MDPASFFEEVFTERTAQLRERADELREELARTESPDHLEGRTEPDHG